MFRKPCGHRAVLAAWAGLGWLAAMGADVTFFSWSDTHYEVEDAGTRTKVDVINSLPGTAYPASVGGGTVVVPRGVILQGDLIDDGGNQTIATTQWANWSADFSVAGSDAGGVGRCRFPAFEGIGNHDVNPNLFMYSNVAARNLTRQNLGLIGSVSPNGYHYSWDWDGVHFIQLNLFCGDIWRGEGDGYGDVHDPKASRDFLIQDLQATVGNSGRPVVVIQHYQPTNEGWWTRRAIDRWYQAMQDYNVIAVLTGHQGGGNSAIWRGLNWVNSNGTLDVFRISPDNKLTVLERTDSGTWNDIVQRNIYTSYASSGIPAAVNNGDWATHITPTSATLSGKLLYQGTSSTQSTVFWGTTDGGTTPANWQNSRDLGTVGVGTPFTTEVTGLQPWTTHYYRVRVTNSMGSAWAATSIDFATAGDLPSGWNTAFIGYEQRSGGGAREEAGTFTVRGSGRDIGEGGQGIDNFQYAFRSLSGDGEVRARVATVPVASRNPKVGVMLRETLDAGSRQSSVLLSSAEGVRFMNRTATGGSTTASANNTIRTAPYWVRLTRSGNTFTGSMSPDGITWTQVGNPATIAMPATIYAGIPVTAGNRDGSVHHTSTFDNVAITGEGLPMPPIISNVPDQIVEVNGSTGPLAVMVGDLETPPGELTLTASSSNPTLVPNANLTIGGSGSARTVTVTPVAGLTGTATITLTVNDGALTASDTFLLTVLPAQLYVTQWQSVSDHNATPQGLTISESPLVECRQAGIRRIEVTFSAPVSISNASTAFTISGVNSAGSINLGSHGITASASAAGNVLSLTFANGPNPVALPDATKWRLTLNPAVIAGSGGLVLTPSAATTRLLTGLVGDVDSNGRITGLDLNHIANADTYSPGVAASLKADVNGDGVINLSDREAAWNNLTKRTDMLATP